MKKEKPFPETLTEKQQIVATAREIFVRTIPVTPVRNLDQPGVQFIAINCLDIATLFHIEANHYKGINNEN
jgi:hypothetical protein